MEFNVMIIMPLAFCCEFIDSSLGMGYGTILAPVLLLMGYEPLQVVPAILLSEFVSGIMAAFFHHSVKNVDFKPSGKDARIAMVLSGCAILGTLVSVIIAIRLPPEYLKITMGTIIASMGIYLIIGMNRNFKFSWKGIGIIGTIASFNKGMSGGGYGPLVTGGQLLSGVGARNAVGITSLSEGLTCLLGVILYAFLKSDIDWTLAPWLMAGAVLSVPLAAHTVKRIPEKRMRTAIACTVLLLGAITLSKGLI